MNNVCLDCGMYEVEREVIDGGADVRSFAICSSCGARLPFIQRPLFVVTGASGAGKSATCLELMSRDTGLLPLESDILWGAIDAEGENGVDRYWNAWLRLVKNINQGPLSVILCGTVVPGTLERQPERRFIGATHYLALVVDPERQERRLRSRPSWRESDDLSFIADQVRFNRWLIDHALEGDPSWDVLDTTSRSPAASADAVLAWVHTCQERSAARTMSSLKLDQRGGASGQGR